MVVRSEFLLVAALELASCAPTVLGMLEEEEVVVVCALI
jgi:hypothetical protein